MTSEGLILIKVAVYSNTMSFHIFNHNKWKTRFGRSEIPLFFLLVRSGFPLGGSEPQALPSAAVVCPISQSSSLALRKSPLAWGGLGFRDTSPGISRPCLGRPGMHPSCFKYSLCWQGLCCALMGLVVRDLGYDSLPKSTS